MGVDLVVYFIVLEDNPLHRKNVKDIIINYMMKNKHEFDILFFEKETDTLLNLIDNHDANYIYILDFELPNTTAIDFARKIRTNDWSSPIIIFTVNGGMAFDTFKQRLQILDFVPKQYEAEKNLHELFDICFKQFNVRKTFKYRVGRADYTLDFDKILYIYKDTVERKSIIVTTTNKHELSMNLVKIKELLNEDFIFTHKACIVNLKRVAVFVWNEGKVIFDNGVEAPFLSKTHKKELSKSVCG